MFPKSCNLRTRFKNYYYHHRYPYWKASGGWVRFLPLLTNGLPKIWATMNTTSATLQNKALHFLDAETKTMTVSICKTNDDSDCAQCACAVKDCSMYPFGDWLHYNCDDLQGNYMRVTNEKSGKWLGFAEIEAFGYILQQ